LSAKVRKLARRERIDDAPSALVGLDRTLNPSFVLGPQWQHLRSSLEKNGQHLSDVSCVRIRGAPAVCLAALSATLNHAAAHQRLVRELSQLIMESASAALVGLAFAVHIW
jgi:hypothetical protein